MQQITDPSIKANVERFTVTYQGVRWEATPIGDGEVALIRKCDGCWSKSEPGRWVERTHQHEAIVSDRLFPEVSA